MQAFKKSRVNIVKKDQPRSCGFATGGNDCSSFQDGWIPPEYVHHVIWHGDQLNSGDGVDVDTNTLRLFDLEADPGEKHDLSRQRPADARRLLRRLEELVRETKCCQRRKKLQGFLRRPQRFRLIWRMRQREGNRRTLEGSTRYDFKSISLPCCSNVCF